MSVLRASRSVLRAACCIATVLAPDAAGAQRLAVGAGGVFYGDNTEFASPFREGETLAGAWARAFVDLELTDRVTIRGGAFGNQRFGSERVFETARPVLSLIVRSPAARLVFGTLEPPSPASGPDRAGPHGLLPPLQVETLAFTRPYESGIQWTRAGRFDADAWLAWQALNTPEHRERFDAGGRGLFTVARRLRLAYQGHVVHHGGQLHASGPVADSLAGGPGIELEARLARPRISIEAFGLLSRHVPDREAPRRSRTGAGVFVRGTAEAGRWRGHVIIWRACDFVKEEGDPNYQSRRRDGTPFRRTRDYAEIGLTRAWQPAPDVRIDAAMRLHRVDSKQYYEYSYRILATWHTRWPP